MLAYPEPRCPGNPQVPLCDICDRRNWHPGVMHPVIAPEVTVDITLDGAQCPNYIAEPDSDGG